MHVLVMGSSGSLGQAIINRLLLGAYTVTGIDQHQPVGYDRSYNHITADLAGNPRTDDQLMRKLITPGYPNYTENKYDYVINCAATIYGVVGFNENPADILCNDLRTNATGLEIAKYMDAKYIYISSSMVYESAKNAVDLTEDMPDILPAPATEYGLSKYVGEKQCQSYGRQHSLNWRVWRPFNIITPHEEIKGRQGYSHVFADFIDQIVFKEKDVLPILGDGSQVRSFTWIGDVADIIVDSIPFEKTNGRILNIGNPNNAVTMTELGSIIYSTAKRMFPEEFDHRKHVLSFDPRPAPEKDVKNRIPSVDKLIDFYQEINKPLPTFKPLEECVRRCLSEAYKRKFDAQDRLKVS